MTTPTLHEPLDFGWPWRKLEDTEHSNTQLADGRVELRIWHDLLPGVTLDMIAWWFQNLTERGEYRGKMVDYYRLWHPRDHIKVTAQRNAEGKIVAGGRIHIQEAFSRNMEFLVDEQPSLHRWDRGGVGLHVDKLGHRVMELDHVFRERPEGLIYETLARIGASAGPLSGLIERHIVPHEFGPQKANAWLVHNVEEVGCTPYFLPELYAANVR